MRKYLVVGLAGALALALTAVAFAAQVNKADIKFTSKKAGSSTGVSSTFNVTDPDNHTAGKEGKPTRQISRVDILFPAKTTFNYKKFAKVHPCTYQTAKQITAKCKKALIATGSTTVDGRGGLLGGVVTGTLKAYNTSKGLAIVIKSKNNIVDGQTLFPQYKGTKLVTTIPGALAAPGVDAYLSKFKLVIKSFKFKPKGAKKKVAYVALPKKCPKAKQWKVKTKFTYKAGGSFTTAGTVNKCKK